MTVEMTYDELLAAGLCDCGTPLEGHPPLPKPLPWSYGRPCGKPAGESRWSTTSRREPDDEEA